MENICLKCTFYTKNGRCNRLVFTCVGMNDRLGVYYKKGNYCPYFESGSNNRDRDIHGLNFFNS